MPFGVRFTSDDAQNVGVLAGISKSIKTLEIFFYSNISGIIKLIEAQINLNDVRFSCQFKNKELHTTLEESLIKHANTIQYLRITWIPVTKTFSYLVNLISLDIN